MAVPTEEQVRTILASFHTRLRRVVDEAWAEWCSGMGKSAWVFLPRVRATVVFDFIAKRAIAEFAGDPDIRVIAKKQTVQFLFRDIVLLRFKKGNGRGIGSNIRTQAVLDFIDPARTIPGLVPDILKVELCWDVNDLGIDLNEVAVVARNERKRIWAYPLERAEHSAEVIPMPPLEPSTEVSRPVVVPRVAKRGGRSDTGE